MAEEQGLAPVRTRCAPCTCELVPWGNVAHAVCRLRGRVGSLLLGVVLIPPTRGLTSQAQRRVLSRGSYLLLPPCQQGPGQLFFFSGPHLITEGPPTRGQLLSALRSWVLSR